ncbi:MAG: flavodoxin domain-containing protein [Myxococcota bacterium]
MKVLIAYATQEGHTQRVAEAVAEAVERRGFSSVVLDTRVFDEVDLRAFGAAILTAPVHRGRHEESMVRFVQAHRTGLSSLPTAFLSVSMSARGAQDEDDTPKRRQEAADRVHEQMESFFDEVDWHPDREEAVAGALAYREYGLVVRWVMKRIAKRTGADVDTSRDYIYTDWDALTHFAEEFCDSIEASQTPAKASSAGSTSTT